MKSKLLTVKIILGLFIAEADLILAAGLSSWHRPRSRPTVPGRSQKRWFMLSPMVTRALAEAPTASAQAAHEQLARDPSTRIVDPRDAANIAATGIVSGAVNKYLGTSTYKADHEVPEEWCGPKLKDFARPIMTSCELAEMAALAGKLFKDMGYANVHIHADGTVAWLSAGFPITPIG